MTVTDQTKLLLSEAGGGNFIISEIVKAYKLFFIFLIKGEVCIYLYYLREFCFPFSWGNQIFLLSLFMLVLEAHFIYIWLLKFLK